DLDCARALGVGRRATGRTDLHCARIVITGDPATPTAGPPRDLYGYCDLALDRLAADERREITVHPDGVLVDLFGVDGPRELLGSNVDFHVFGDRKSTRLNSSHV